MKQFWAFAGTILLALLVIFILFEQANLPILQIPDRFMEAQSISMALLSIALLILDIFLPIPASLIMIANGAMYGLLLGTLLSLIGSVGATLTGFAIGKRSRTWVANHMVSEQQMDAAQEMFARWGMVAIIITRPMPLLAETTAIVAGTSGMSVQQLLISAIAGALPTAAIYALVGNFAMRFHSAMWSFLLVMGVATIFWLLTYGRFQNESFSKRDQRTQRPILKRVR
ncbi:MAG: VTT domain-containing protein [Chloroflexota bacterium]